MHFSGAGRLPVRPKPFLVLLCCVGILRLKCSSHSECGWGTKWMRRARSGVPYSRARRFLTLILAPASRTGMAARWGLLASALAWPKCELQQD